MAEIQLTRGYVAIVDDADFERLSAFKWCVQGKEGQCLYAVRNFQGRQIAMHRQIIDPPADREIDHINRNTLDNRRANLRVCTRRENMCNAVRPNAAGYRGIAKAGKKWRARIVVEGRVILLGSHATPEAAARVRDDAARMYHGEFATLNFPDGGA